MLKRIPDIDRFPWGITQENDLCIPTSIEAVAKYFDQSFSLNQRQINQLFRNACIQRSLAEDTQINLELIKKLVLDVDPQFGNFMSRYIPRSELADYRELATRIELSIETDLPHIVSIPKGGGYWHMVTVVGVSSRSFFAYDPDPSLPRTEIEYPKEKLKELLVSKDNGNQVTDSLVLKRIRWRKNL